MEIHLTVLMPRRTLVERKVTRVVAEAPNGFFCLLPRHVDFATAIVPGILSFTTPVGEEIFIAVDQGVLVKQTATVLVSTLNAAMGEDLGRLEEMVSQHFRKREEQEEKALQAASKIEAGFVRRFLDIQQTE
jgi:F-type H+-transporting ATPase subunit epsilon